MARITVEDCLENVENRFELVMLAINLLKEFRIKDFDLEINCLGDNKSLVKLSNQILVQENEQN